MKCFKCKLSVSSVTAQLYQGTVGPFRGNNYHYAKTTLNKIHVQNMSTICNLNCLLTGKCM